MSEIQQTLLLVGPGEIFTADDDGAIVITGAHSHADILRHVVADIGEDAKHVLDRVLAEAERVE